MSGMLELPEDCIAAVISFTTPRDACRLACVSTIFRSAADSISFGTASCIRSRTLDQSPVLRRSATSIASFWLDRPSGKICYMISPRELYSVCYDCTELWQIYPIDIAHYHFSIPDCRFPGVLIRFDVISFEVGGKISTSLLSPMTTYTAYLVFAEGLIFCRDDAPAKVAVGLARSTNGLNRTIYLHRVHLDGDDDGFFPKRRADGWLESELGEFFNGGDEEGELSMTMKTCWKENLLIQGIEIRPKKE
ncbi:hypothetical protein Dsin_007551 [Dipteronia sinensis]|uniref:F-box domain-containing protein n=1 Tax=Dipteronia sinensis TaxID=43782 RepID=A0AAE0B1Z0_9ROSI|nr:hypothetical protein Dsin_007551 [Dipteronia sinensis]